MYEGRLKSLYDNVISAVDQWDPSTATVMEEVCGAQRGLCWKINLIWSYSMKVSWSGYELFSKPLFFFLKYSLKILFCIISFIRGVKKKSPKFLDIMNSSL